jgi:AraC-like DNA-binding protein
MPVATVANFAARGILSVSASRGVDVAALIREAGVDEALVAEPGTRLPLDSVIRLWELARRRTRDEHIALHVAEFLPFGAYKTYDFFLATAPTIGEGLGKAAKYNGFVNDAFRPALRRKRGQIWIEYTNCIDPQCHPPEYIEFIFACFLLRFRLTTGVDWRPREVHFRHPPPRDLSDHHRIFQAPVLFRQPSTGAFVDPVVLRIRQLLADAPTSELLEQYIQGELSARDAFDELTLMLRQTLRSSLSGGGGGLAAAARNLGLSRRALQRKLAARGTSYREQLRAIRCDVALMLLDRPDISTSEAADAAGFAELSSFSRAFKRWTGMSPQGYRRKPNA